MEQVIIGNSIDLVHPTSTNYCAPIGFATGESPLSPRYEFLVSTAGTLKNLRVELSGDPGAGKQYAFTILLNGNPTALDLVIADTATSNEDADSFAVAAGDRISLRSVPSGSPTARSVKFTMIFEGDTANESLLGGGKGVTNNAATRYHRVMGDMDPWPINEDNARVVCPTAGVIKKLYIRLSESPGSGADAYRFTLRLDKTTVGESSIVTITQPDTTGNDVAHNLVVAAGDVLTLISEPLNSPSASPKFSMGLTFVATTDGESVIMGGDGDALHSTNTEYNSLCGGRTWGSSATRGQLAQSCILKDFYVLLSGSPGSGKNYTFTIRDSGGDTGTVVVISDAATTGSKTDNDHTLHDGDALDLESVPAGSPTPVTAYWGLVSYIEPPAVAAAGASPLSQLISAGIL